MLDLSSPGITDIMIFKEAAPKTFKIEDREDIDIKKKELPKKSWWNIAATIGRRQSFFQQFPKMYYQTLITYPNVLIRNMVAKFVGKKTPIY